MILAKWLKERKKEEEEEDLEFALIDRRRAAARSTGKNCPRAALLNLTLRLQLLLLQCFTNYIFIVCLKAIHQYLYS